MLLAFYGDDFTGSTDALEFLSRAGAKTMLFVEPPSAQTLAQYPDVEAIGVAGLSRSMSPEAMQQTLTSAFQKLKSLNPRHVHYKVCSTFDSSPTIGSIGKAIEVGLEIFDNDIVPVLVAAPSLGRHCVFGNLFAKMGIGSEGQIHRLDRHPSMIKHPTTPADESDLQLHLARQTTKQIGLVNILEIVKPSAEILEIIENRKNAGTEIVFFDAIYEHQLSNIGKVFDEMATPKTLFSVGSSGVEMALGNYWNETNELTPPQQWPCPERCEPLLVVSGSCSPVTGRQIAWASQHGFLEIGINLAQPNIENVTIKAQEALLAGTSVIIHTQNEYLTNTISAQFLGTMLGQIAKNIFANVNLQRLVVAGGDTSSFAARAMGIEAVEMIAPLVAGAPLCRAYAPNSPLHLKEVNFKGGQVGAENYFGILQQGTI